MLFLSVEFFDFELQTTPLVQGPEASFAGYRMLYDVVVSNLFVHYLATSEGMELELFIVKGGVSYEQLGSARLSLRQLISIRSKPSQLSGEVGFSSNGTVVASLAYAITVPFSLAKALMAQRRQMLSASYLPLRRDEVNEEEFRLHLDLNRVDGVDAFSGGSGDAVQKVYLAYQLFDLPVHMSPIVEWPSKGSLTFADTHTWTLPGKSRALDTYLRREELLVYLLSDDTATTGGKAETQLTDGALAYCSIPLFPLARNKAVKGSFPLGKLSGERIDGAALAVSLRWEKPYRYEDADVEVEGVDAKKVEQPQGQVSRTEGAPGPGVAVSEEKEAPSQRKTEVSTQPESLTAKPESITGKELIDRRAILAPWKTPSPSTSHPLSVDAEKQQREDAISPRQGSSQSSLSSEPSIKSAENAEIEIEKKVEPSKVPEIGLDHAKEQVSQHYQPSSSIHTHRLKTKPAAEASSPLLGPLPSILPPIATPEAPKSVEIEEDTVMLSSPSPTSSSLTPSQVGSITSSHDENELEVREMPSVEEIKGEGSEAEAEFDPSTPTTPVVEVVEKPVAPVRRSLLGNLPPLGAPGMSHQQDGRKGVEWTEPLHLSIPRGLF